MVRYLLACKIDTVVMVRYLQMQSIGRYDRHDSGMLIASLCNIDAIPVGMVIAYCIDLLLQ
jgi:hypothetical protein